MACIIKIPIMIFPFPSSSFATILNMLSDKHCPSHLPLIWYQDVECQKMCQKTWRVASIFQSFQSYHQANNIPSQLMLKRGKGQLCKGKLHNRHILSIQSGSAMHYQLIRYASDNEIVCGHIIWLHELKHSCTLKVQKKRTGLRKHAKYSILNSDKYFNFMSALICII